MNILILSRKPNLHFNKKIEQVAKTLDINVTIVDPLNCDLLLAGNDSQILCKDKPIENIHFVIPRMGPMVLEYGLSVLKHFELRNIPVLNSSRSLINLINRYEYLQTLSCHAKILIPRSVLIRKSNQVKNALKYVNGPPAIVKVLSSQNNLGAILIDSAASAESFVDLNFMMGGLGQICQNIVIEEYIKEAEGKSTYVLILNNQVIGSYYKIKALSVKSFTAATTKPSEGIIVPDKSIIEMALAAVKVLNLDFAEVRFIESIDGPKLFEININPEIEIYEKDPNTQVPASILAHITNLLKVKH